MPRVVPSQIVEFIDAEFPFARARQPPSVSHAHKDNLSALLRLVDELPDELKIIDGGDYSRFLRSLETIRSTVIHTGGNTVPYNSEKRLGDAISDVRVTLERLPDQQVPAATAGLPFIADPQLRESIRADIAFANQAFSGGEWKAVTVLAGAAAEALLLWAITAKKTKTEVGAARSATIPKASPDPNYWDLDAYTKVAKALTLIDDETERQADIARGFRNLIHPGRSARLAKVCDKGTAHSALAAVEFIVRDLS
jgi:hypothetical protein